MALYFSLFLLSGLFALLFTPAVRRLGHGLAAYGQAGETRPTPRIPRLGGLAILLAVLGTCGALLLTLSDSALNWPRLARILLPGVLVLALGVYDDLVGATPAQKLAVEALASCGLWMAGVRLTFLPLLGFALKSEVLSFFLTVLWTVTVMNGMNLVDGLDGLAAGLGSIVCLTLFLLSLIERNTPVCFAAIVLAGALVGFLRFNFGPATIYLGDTGSLFVGFVLAALATLASEGPASLAKNTLPFVAFAPPIFEVTVTLARRLLGRRPLFVPDRDHVHHRLRRRVRGPHSAVLTIYALASLCWLGSLLVLLLTHSRTTVLVVLSIGLGWWLRYLQYDEFQQLPARLLRQLGALLQPRSASPCSPYLSSFNTDTAKVLGALCVRAFTGTENTEQAAETKEEK